MKIKPTITQWGIFHERRRLAHISASGTVKALEHCLVCLSVCLRSKTSFTLVRLGLAHIQTNREGPFQTSLGKRPIGRPRRTLENNNTKDVVGMYNKTGTKR